MCRQNALLALRRSVMPTTPIRSERKSELTADIAAECDTRGSRQRIFARVFVNLSMQELRLASEGARLHGPSGPEALKARLDSSHCQYGRAHCHRPHCERADTQGHMF